MHRLHVRFHDLSGPAGDDGVTVAVKFVEGLAAAVLGTSKICAYAQPNAK